MRHPFRVNSKVRISDENECYAKYAGKVLRVVHCATKYMPSTEFFKRGKPDGYHPGFDAASGCALYDMETLKGEPVPFSCYAWELEEA